MNKAPSAEGYEIQGQIGVGGFSTVYRASQVRFARQVALKVLHARLGDEQAQRRFDRECRAAGSMSNYPYIATVFDAGECKDGRPFIAIELMEGGSYAARLAADGPLTGEEGLDVGVKMAAALSVVHASGMLHRDIKPENILRNGFGEPALTDFGISAVVLGPEATTGTVSLTPLHTSPEELEGAPSSIASDVYSLGSALYTLLEGRAPFQGPAGEGIAPFLRRVTTEEPLLPSRRDLPDGLVAAVMTALEKDPMKRPGSALALAELLQSVQVGSGLGVTPIPRAMVAAQTPLAANIENAATIIRGPGAAEPQPDAQGGSRPGVAESLLSNHLDDIDVVDRADVSETLARSDLGTKASRDRAPIDQHGPAGGDPADSMVVAAVPPTKSRRRAWALIAGSAAVAACLAGVLLVATRSTDTAGLDAASSADSGLSTAVGPTATDGGLTSNAAVDSGATAASTDSVDPSADAPPAAVDAGSPAASGAKGAASGGPTGSPAGQGAGNGGNAAGPVPAQAQPVTIISQPRGRAVPVRESTTLSVSASGPGPLLYQWYRDGSAIAGAASPSYTTPTLEQVNGSPTYSTQFWVTVTGSNGAQATSSVATVNVDRRSLDINGDGLVNQTEMNLVCSHYGTDFKPADFNGDHTVSIVDLSMVLTAWTPGQPGGTCN